MGWAVGVSMVLAFVGVWLLSYAFIAASNEAASEDS
jgi:hypothetical protein